MKTKKYVKQIIRDISTIGYGFDKIKDIDSFKYDLYFDDYDMVELVTACENYFNIEIEDKEFESWATVADVIKTVKGKL